MRIASINKTKQATKQTILPLITLITILSCKTLPQPPLNNNPSITATETTQETITITEHKTQTNNLQPTPTQSAYLSETITAGEEQTPTPIPISSTPTTVQEILVYPQLQSPVYLVNFLHPELGCQWAGVAGQIFNTAGIPVNGYIIEVSGSLDGEEFLALGLTGTSLPIGPGGYEIKLADKPFDSLDSLSLRVFDQSGKQLNETFPLTTYNDCRKNLILLNFILLNQPLKEKIYFPIIYR